MREIDYNSKKLGIFNIIILMNSDKIDLTVNNATKQLYSLRTVLQNLEFYKFPNNSITDLRLCGQKLSFIGTPTISYMLYRSLLPRTSETSI